MKILVVVRASIALFLPLLSMLSFAIVQPATEPATDFQCEIKLPLTYLCSYKTDVIPAV